MTTQSPYRRRSLERIASPDDLDRLVRVTQPRRWIALAAVLSLLAVALAWAVVSTVPTTVRGSGYVLPQSGLRVLQSDTVGRVTALGVGVGDHVIAGAVVGSVRSPSGASVPILAPETGIVTEIDAVAGGYVNAGGQVGLVEPAGWPLVVYAYVPTDQAAHLSRGTLVHVKFGGGIGSSYGFAVGHVDSISAFPATLARLSYTLQDSSVIDSIRGLGPVNEAVITLDQSATTPSGVVWGHGSGPPGPLVSGLPASAEFVIGSHHPIDDVL
jgi:HlyD family secretion protein